MVVPNADFVAVPLAEDGNILHTTRNWILIASDEKTYVAPCGAAKEEAMKKVVQVSDIYL